jgi:hypothetical protein
MKTPFLKLLSTNPKAANQMLKTLLASVGLNKPIGVKLKQQNGIKVTDANYGSLYKWKQTFAMPAPPSNKCNDSSTKRINLNRLASAVDSYRLKQTAC